MPVQLPELNKRYYTTGEVAKFFGVTRSTIRYWEKQFDILQAHKFGNGERRFTADQVRMVQKIHLLVRERGFTIKGAEQELQEHRKWYKEKDRILKKLRDVRKNLHGLRLEI